MRSSPEVPSNPYPSDPFSMFWRVLLQVENPANAERVRQLREETRERNRVWYIPIHGIATERAALEREIAQMTPRERLELEHRFLDHEIAVLGPRYAWMRRK